MIAEFCHHNDSHLSSYSVKNDRSSCFKTVFHKRSFPFVHVGKHYIMDEVIVKNKPLIRTDYQKKAISS